MRHSDHISAFIASVQLDQEMTREQKGRALREAINHLEEVLDNYPDPDELEDEG